MEVVEAKSSSGYGKPPWVFRGSAWYQLHLVKAEKARACIPKEFKLVEAFGYTLGGFFLASYEDSPVGVFDELVVIAGLVWNRPTSCAWATRVYVNNDDACCHGRKEVGLPSQMARFSRTITAISRQPRDRKSGFLNKIGIGAMFSTPKDPLNVQVTKIKCLEAEDTCNINISLTGPVPALGFGHWMGPTISMSLPSFSGGTEYNPNLLKYSCKIECRVQALKPLKVSGAFPSTNDDTEQSLEDYGGNSHVAKDHKNDAQNFSTCVMLSKPILALKFSQMKMQVEAPVVLSQCSNSLETTVSSVP
ncbi:carboxy-lyase protein [Spatholobus suberectus]|nr:carboxy-lyase protein [Spatholobus suberectus]